MGALSAVGKAVEAAFKMPLTFDPGTHWHLMIDNKHPGAASFTQKTGHITEIARIDWDYSYDAVLSLLGFSYSDGTTLRRRAPLRHPTWTNMSATAITDARGVKFDGQISPNKPGALPKDASYKFYEVNVNFEPLNMLCLADSSSNPRTGAMIKEWERYTSYEFNFTAQALERPTGNQITWAEGPSIGNAVPNKIFTVEKHADIAFTWHCVPEGFVTDISTSKILPQKFVKAIGTVNADTFMGMPPGTLLFKPPIIKRYPSPLIPTNPGDLKMYLDITLMLDYFNPTLGASPALSAGHQVVPCFTGASSEILYYLVRIGGATGAAAAIAAAQPGGGSAGCIYPFSSFSNCFTHWSL